MRQAQRSKQGHVNLILFRLAACCGVRVSEIANLHMTDVRTDGSRPHLRTEAVSIVPVAVRVSDCFRSAGWISAEPQSLTVNVSRGRSAASGHRGPQNM
jgi:hypothetical protein